MKQRKTGGIVLLAALLFLFLAVSLLTVVRIQRQTRDHGMMINQLGIVRGMTQRIVKLELAGENTVELVRSVDDTITLYHRRFRTASLDQIMRSVEEQWVSLKETIELHRGARTDEKERLEQALLEQSETMWRSTNASVFLGQMKTEESREMFRFIALLVLVELIIGGLILFLFIRVVRLKIEPGSLLDPLTGCYNRNVFFAELQSEISRAERYKVPFSLIEFDIDHFKKVNDSYGHDTGDRVLRELTAYVRGLLRSSDILARTGGEEFTIIVPHTDAADARRLAEKLRKEIEEYNFDLPEPVTCSFGVSTYSEGESWQDLFSRADELLYNAKENGRNRVEGEPV